MTDDEIKRLRRACETASPQIYGRQVSLDPRTLTSLLDEVERLRAIDVSNVGDMIILSDTNVDLRAEIARMRSVYEAAKSWRHNVPSYKAAGGTTTGALVDAVDAAIANEPVPSHVRLHRSRRPESPTSTARTELLMYLRERREQVSRTLHERRELLSLAAVDRNTSLQHEISYEKDAAEIGSLDGWIAWLSGDEVKIR